MKPNFLNQGLYIYYIRPLFLCPVCGPFKHTECLQYEENIQIYICKIYLHIICYKKVCKVRLYLKLQLTKNE